VISQKSDPRLRTSSYHICAVLHEHIEDLIATGNTSKQAKLVKNRIELVIAAAAFSEYAEVDAVRVAKAIAKLQADNVFCTATTANNYREAMRAWSRWMKKNGRWPTNPLEDMPKIKGDTSNSRPRAILSDKQFEQLLRATRVNCTFRNSSVPWSFSTLPDAVGRRCHRHRTRPPYGDTPDGLSEGVFHRNLIAGTYRQTLACEECGPQGP
jgi:hypothetical protein